ncbi:MAG: outer membrane beta-barrel protein [Pseudomonadota bacterium]
MKNRSFLKSAILAACSGALTAAIAAPASAGGLFDTEPEQSRLYVSVFGGASFLTDSTFNGVSNPEVGVPAPTGIAGAPLSVELDADTGFTFGGAIGYQFGFKYLKIFHPRVEIEVSYLSNNIGEGSFNGGSQTFSGEQDTLFVYINNYSDIKFHEDQKFVPYIGGGFGLGFVDSDVSYFPATASAPVFGVFGDDTAFAGHVAVGATYALSDKLELYSEGRYFRVNNVDLERRFIGGGADLFVGDVESRIDGFTATGGLRYTF